MKLIKKIFIALTSINFVFWIFVNIYCAGGLIYYLSIVNEYGVSMSLPFVLYFNVLPVLFNLGILIFSLVRKKEETSSLHKKNWYLNLQYIYWGVILVNVVIGVICVNYF